MRYRIVFALVAVFFVAMNLLLWRAEFAGQGRLTSPVAVASVWEKMVLAQDASSLLILHQGRRVGYCRWNPTVLQQRTPTPAGDDMSPEGLTQAVIGYTLDLDGHFLIEEPLRLRFNANMKLDTNFVWQSFQARLLLRPDVWEIQADASAQRVRIRIEDENGRREQNFKFSDFENPERIARRLGLGAWVPALAALGLPMSRGQTTNLVSNFAWRARRDRLQIGGTQFPAYRVEARWMNRPQATCFVSNFGEVFRAELPGEIVLMTDAMSNF